MFGVVSVSRDYPSDHRNHHAMLEQSVKLHAVRILLSESANRWRTRSAPLGIRLQAPVSTLRERVGRFKVFSISLFYYLKVALVQCMPQGYPVIDFNPVVLVATPLRLWT
jgi:hypothetical protein